VQTVPQWANDQVNGASITTVLSSTDDRADDCAGCRVNRHLHADAADP
jgi:hypothetical protein